MTVLTPACHASDDNGTTSVCGLTWSEASRFSWCDVEDASELATCESCAGWLAAGDNAHSVAENLLPDPPPAVPAEPACPGCNRTRRQLASTGASWGSAYAKCSDCAPEEFHAVPGEPETFAQLAAQVFNSSPAPSASSVSRPRHRVGYVSMGAACFFCTAGPGEECRDEPDKRVKAVDARASASPGRAEATAREVAHLVRGVTLNTDATAIIEARDAQHAAELERLKTMLEEAEHAAGKAHIATREAQRDVERLRAELETEQAAHVDAVADANEKMQRLRAELAEARQLIDAATIKVDEQQDRAALAFADAERLRVALNVADDAITDAINDYRDCECPGWSPGKPDTHGSCSKRELLIALQKVRAALSGSGAAPEGGTGGTR